jgi:hypothetical protein
MKKRYVTPSVELVKFQYSEQVVAASQCIVQVTNVGEEKCTSGGGHTFEHN